MTEQQANQRWAALLRQSLGAAPAVDATDARSRLDRARGQHRAWIVACLHALAAHRGGHAIELQADLPAIDLPAPAARGSDVAQAVWSAYVQAVLGSAAASAWLDDAIRTLDPTALIAGVEDNPEPWWANELLILHALQSHALQRRDPELIEQVTRCAAFHIAEIQPDHATNEPWAVHALALHPLGNVTAETLLHAAHVYGGGSLTPVARLVVADALHALEA